MKYYRPVGSIVADGRFRGTKIAGNKRIFLITDNDEPVGSTSNRAPARTVYTVRTGDILPIFG